jgi:tRNA A37 methylthiotransferase MiaB
VIDERIRVLRALAAEKAVAHRRRFVGQSIDALTLRTPPDQAEAGKTASLTENYLPVTIEGRLAANRLVRVVVSALDGSGALVARIERSSNLLAPSLELAGGLIPFPC